MKALTLLKISGILIVLFLIIFLFFSIQAPGNFQPNTIISIEEGGTVKGVSEKLESLNIIKSGSLFSFFIGLNRNHVVAGKYIFKEPETLFQVLKRVARGEYGSNIVDITLFEGMTREEMAQALASKINGFNQTEFLELTQNKEGYLFPDTYKINDLMNASEIVALLEDNFKNKIESINDLIESSDYSLEQIIIMASIIEKEADLNSRQEVSNILWKRYEEDLPLQVDAPFVYAIGKGTFDLTLEDLNSDNPYNTYNRLGLPPTAISNPGLDSIKAAAMPEKTEYYYFLTGNDGKMYYAKNFEQHKRNRALYLDN